MAKCGISNNELIKISRIVTNHLRLYKKTPGANIDLTLNNIIDNLTETYDINNDNVNDVIDILSERAGYIFPLGLPEQFNLQNLVKKLLNIDSPNENVVVENSDDQLFQLDIITERRGSASKFWDKEYGFAGEVKAYAMNQSNQFIFDSCFINRGSIGENIGIVLNTKQLNENLRIYQQILLDRIVKYLKYIGKDDPVLDNAILYDENGKNTGVLSALRAMIDENLGKMSTDDLRVMYGIAKDNNSTSDKKELYLLKLDAYNARVLLDNFDSALLHTLGDSIVIRDFGIKTGKDKYQIADKTAKLLHTWRTKEDINAEDEINGIVKLAITTLPLLTYGSAPCTQSSVYLKYQDFQYIVAKIKDLIYKLDDNIRFDELMMSLSEREFFESLSQNTQDVLRNKSLRSVINSIRENPRKYIPAIFEVLSRSEFLDEHDELRQQFRQDELNRLYSVTIGCFVGGNSFYALSTNNADIDYFGFITQVADTVFNNKYIQYGYGPNGEIGVYTLQDQGINKVARTIEQTINTNNSRKLLNSKWTFWKSCNIDGGIDRSSDDKLAPITFDVPTSMNDTNGNQIKLHGMVYTSTGDVTFLLGDKVITDFTDVDINLDINDVINFIDSILNIDITNNVNMRNAVIEQLGGPVNAYNHLMRFAARTLALVYTSNKLIREDEKKSKIWTILNMIDSMKRFYPESSTNNRLPRFNYTLGEPGLIDNNDTRILEGIAIAKANVEGLLTAAQVKDGSGKSLSQLTLSRLMYSYRSQFELLEKLPDSASKNFMLLKNPKLLEGIVVMKEFRDRDGKIKEFKEMTTAEMCHSSFLYDFIGGLMLRKTRNVSVGDGHVMFISSVNSDKTLMTKLCIDLNLKVQIGEKVKALKDLNSKELEYLISSEFGDFYENIITNIQSDLSIIDSVISECLDPNELSTVAIDLVGVEKAPSLAADFVTGYRNFNDWFYRNIGKLSQYGNNPVVFLRRITREINNRYRNEPITLIDQTHFKSVRNHEGRVILGVNEALIANLYRYKPNSKYIAKYKSEFASKYPSSELFWKTMKLNSARLLLNENFKINTSNTQQSEKLYLRSINNDFINRSGDVVIVKVKLPVEREGEVRNEWIDVTSINDVITAGFPNVDALFNSAVDIAFNPMLEKYLYLDFLISQEFIDSTVGTFTNHPLKNEGNVLEQESGHLIGLNKRNVSLTAAMHQFQLNTLQGISSEYNIAVIDELNDLLGIVTGDIIEWSGMDGATFVNPFNVILENYSLGGQRAGMTKKQFIHAKDHRTGTGIIIKTAGFAMTNDWFRNSPQLKKVFKKMCYHLWIDQVGDVFDPDITHDYNGNPIKFKDIYYKEFDKAEGRVKYYHILTDSDHQIRKDGFGRYIAYREEVDILGNALTVAKPWGFNGVTSNYNLWKFFGGEWSMEFDDNGKLVPSNTSVENTVKVMNSVGIKINENVETQADLYQPLKHSDIHYLVTSGAIKQGAANINSSETFFNDDDLNFFKIKMLLAGILLDKEHEADDSEVSAATLIISACAAMGFTIEESMNLYKALSYQTENNLNNELSSIRNLLIENTEESRIEFCNVLMNTIVKGLANSRSNSFAKTIAESVLERKRDGEKVNLTDVQIPLSDNVVYSRIIAVITSYLTNNGIKLSFKGSLSVLSPSYRLYKLYGDRKYESFDDPDTEILALLDLADANPIVDIENGINNSTQLRQGRTYKVTRLINGLLDEKNVTILTPLDYRNLRYDNTIVKIVENIKVGRELGSYHVTFDAVNAEGQVQSFQILDLDSTNYLTRLQQLKDSPNKETLLAQLYMEAYGEDISNSILIDGFDRWYRRTGKRLSQTLQNDLNNLNPNRKDPLEQFNDFIEDSIIDNEHKEEAYKRLARWFNIKFHTGNGDKIRFDRNRIEEINDENFEEVREFIINRLKRSKLISIGGKLHNINPKSILTEGYEVIMPKVFMTRFGLEQFTDLKEISDDPEYFVKQLIRNNQSKVDNNKYSVRFINSNGNHVYVQHPNQGLTGLSKIDDALISFENGRYYRLNVAGDVLYQLPDDFLGIYDDGKGNDVIVSDNIKFFADSLSYDSIGLSEELLNNANVLNDIIEQLRGSKNNKAANFIKYVDDYIKTRNNSKLFIIEASNNYNNDTSNFLTAGHEKHTSFLRSLDIIASRTPGQSMQSFMSMKIVGFENADANNCYVSTFQLLLQGSDFDIDTVTLTSFNIDNNGKLPLWSPYASLENINMLKASEGLPMPVGEKINIKEWGDTYSLNHEDYNDVFDYSVILNGLKTNLFSITIDKKTGKVKVGINLSTPQLYEQFSKFLTLNNPRKRYLFRPRTDEAKNGLLYLIQLGYQLPYNQDIDPKYIMDLIYDQIKKIIDRHNMYLVDMPFYKKTMIYNNYILKQEHDIILNPVNAIEALAPVDQVTKPLKKIANTSPSAIEGKRRNATAFDKYIGIRTNMVGKYDVGICAVALKSFFALTEYNDWILNHGNAEQQHRLLFRTNQDGQLIDGEKYGMLANVSVIDPSTILDETVERYLSLITTDADAALVISALLSLSTDNAKDLCLDKLNASMKTIGMYLYGVCKGIPIEKLCNWMMSPTGKIICQLMEGDVFNNSISYTNIKKAFKYFDGMEVPKKMLRKYMIYQGIDESGEQVEFKSPYEVFLDELWNLIKGPNGQIPEEYSGKTLGQILYMDIKNKDIKVFINFMDNVMRPLYPKYESKLGRELYNQMIDDIEYYAYQLKTVLQDVISDGNKVIPVLDKLRDLAKGSDEMFHAGRMLSCNLGIKTNTEELLSLVSEFELALYNSLSEDEINDGEIKKNDIKFDIIKMAFDELYLRDCVDDYEQNKHSFNALAVFDTVPHYKGYLQALASAVMFSNQSYKFRTVRDWMYRVEEDFNLWDTSKIIKGISNFVNVLLFKRWMLDSGLTITLPAGFTAFDSKGHYTVLKRDTVFNLGTDWGNASFRKFMEEIIIPTLKRDPNLQDNGFIRSLCNDLYTRTALGNPTIVYTLPINMLPRSELGDQILSMYRIEFDKLKQVGINNVNFDEHYNVKGVMENYSIPDLFILYSMTSTDYTLSENSLIPLFDNMANEGLLESFHRYQDVLDKSGDVLEFTSTMKNDLRTFVAPRDNPKTAIAEYINGYDPVSRKRMLMERIGNEDEQVPFSLDSDYPGAGYNPDRRGNYRIINSGIDSNYYPSGTVLKDINTLKYQVQIADNPANIDITYNVESGDITDIKMTINGNMVSIQLNEPMKMPSCNRNGNRKINEALLEQILQNLGECA